MPEAEVDSLQPSTGAMLMDRDDAAVADIADRPATVARVRRRVELIDVEAAAAHLTCSALVQWTCQ